MKWMKSQKSLEESTHKKVTDQPKEKKEVKKKQSTIKTISKEMIKAEIYWALIKHSLLSPFSKECIERELIVSNNVSR